MLDKILCLPVIIWSFSFICCVFCEHMFRNDSRRVFWLFVNLSILLWKHPNIIWSFGMAVTFINKESEIQAVFSCNWDRSKRSFINVRIYPKTSRCLTSAESANVVITSFLALTECLDFCQRNGLQVECMKEDTEKTPNQSNKKTTSPANQNRLLWVWLFSLYAACHLPFI